MLHYIAFITAMLLLTAVPVRAAGHAATYETALSGEDKRSASLVTFNESCGEECYAASLDCDADGGVNFTFADVEAEIAAKAMTSKTRDFTIMVSGTAFPFSIMKLSYGGEMYGTWLLDGQLANSKTADFRVAIAKAKVFKARIGTVSLTLPVTADVKTWAAACVR